MTVAFSGWFVLLTAVGFLPGLQFSLGRARRKALPARQRMLVRVRAAALYLVVAGLSLLVGFVLVALLLGFELAILLVPVGERLIRWEQRRRFCRRRYLVEKASAVGDHG